MKKSGEFVVITFNPNFSRLGETVYNRRFSKADDGKIKAEFINDEGNTTFSVLFTDFSSEDYEQSAKEAGFENFRWDKLRVSPEGIEKMREGFWDNYEDDCPYMAIVVKK